MNAGTTAPPRPADLPPPPAGRSGWPWTADSPSLPARRPDGTPWPRISIVTPSHDQAAFLEETLRSVLLQGYPNLEYIVIDGGSRDASPEIIRRYAPWLAHYELQSDRGHGAAVNSGFAASTGEILAFLNSDDTYAPGALARVAAEVDPGRGRHLVAGRCPFVDEQGRATGMEHASRDAGFWRILAAWRGHVLPQPACFWSRQAWQESGPLTEAPGELWIDYDLFCRMTRRHRAHFVDQRLATYRLHGASTTMTVDAARKQKQIEAISRRYWGPWWTPRALTLRAALAWHRLDRRGRAQRGMRRGRERWSAGRRLAALGVAAGALGWAPDLALQVAGARWRRRPRQNAEAHRLERLTPWPDGWVGPRLGFDLPAQPGARSLHLEGHWERAYGGAALELSVRVDDGPTQVRRITNGGVFRVTVPVPESAAPRRLVEVCAAPYFVPDAVLANGDRRALCWRWVGAELRR